MEAISIRLNGMFRAKVDLNQLVRLMRNSDKEEAENLPNSDVGA